MRRRSRRRSRARSISPFDERELRFTGEPELIALCAAELTPGELAARARARGAQPSPASCARRRSSTSCAISIRRRSARSRRRSRAGARPRAAARRTSGSPPTRHDPAQEARRGRLREDLVWELCADTLLLPPLAAQLAGRPEDSARAVHARRARAVRARAAKTPPRTRSRASSSITCRAMRGPAAGASCGSARAACSCTVVTTRRNRRAAAARSSASRNASSAPSCRPTRCSTRT